ncbi:Dehydrin [Heracleum sosnowskyi]|uniref:Dehydrin n=1 Tax=Heracleum sosnowskyi TaxID=360622 RepID=A0AAD8HU38_9APIA|nr:Dehydrin [Heracleum sosnowskyi]
MDKYGDGYGNPVVVASERPEYINQSSLVEQLPTTTASGEEEMKTSVDTSGFGMYSSGTGTGAITGGGLLPDQFATTATAIQTQLPCSPPSYSSSEDDGTGGRRKKKGTKEKIEEKVVPAFDAGMITGTNGNGQQVETHHEKKGLMERIKEKLPGHHHHHH